MPLVIKVVVSYPEEGFSQGETLLSVRILNLVIFYLPYHLVFWHKYHIQWQRSCELIMEEAAPIHEGKTWKKLDLGILSLGR